MGSRPCSDSGTADSCEESCTQRPQTTGVSSGLQALRLGISYKLNHSAESGPQNKPTQSGLGPQNDAELINLFQEIENEQTQETPTDLPSPGLELEDKDELIATETLAEIYSNQGLTQRAIETYRQILAQQPDNESIRNKLTYLEQHVEK